MLYVIDNKGTVLHLYCLRILFIFLCLFVNLWTKEGFLTPFTLWVHDRDGDAPSASAAFYCCDPGCQEHQLNLFFRASKTPCKILTPLQIGLLSLYQCPF